MCAMTSFFICSQVHSFDFVSGGKRKGGAGIWSLAAADPHSCAWAASFQCSTIQIVRVMKKLMEKETCKAECLTLDSGGSSSTSLPVSFASNDSSKETAFWNKLASKLAMLSADDDPFESPMTLKGPLDRSCLQQGATVEH